MLAERGLTVTLKHWITEYPQGTSTVLSGSPRAGGVGWAEVTLVDAVGTVMRRS